MGSLIPIGQGADAEIKSRLNKTFSHVNLATLQGLYATENLFDGNHSLHRVAYRLGCHPVDKYNEPSRAKWFYFLRTTMTAAMHDGVNTADAIKSTLAFAQNPANNIIRVIFEAVEVAGASAHYLHPDNATTGFAKMVHGRTLHMLLICPAALDPTHLANDPITPDVDGNGNSVEHPLPLP